MKTLLRHINYVLSIFGILVLMITMADEWELPRVETYYSENKQYKLVITPKYTPDKYYKWNYYKSNKHPQTKKLLRKEEKFMSNISGNDTIQIPCIAGLYRINETDSVLIWQKSMLNDDCPVFAIVANDGSSIATFDNWFSTGYGVNVFVVYNEKGEAQRTYKLEEISPYPLNDYPMSITRICWRNEVRFIDNERIEIVFETQKKLQTIRVYNTKSLKFEE